MKRRLFVTLFVFVMLLSSTSFAQFNPYADQTKMLTGGVGFSGWGIPLFIRYEHPVADNITVGGTLSFQNYSETYSSYKWKHSISGLNGRGSYHFNELLNVPEQFDLYAGASLGYYFWNTKYEGSGDIIYSGSGAGGFSLGGYVGGRYFFSDKIAVNLEFGGGTVLAGGTLGVTFVL